MSTNYVISQIDEVISRLDRIESKLNSADKGELLKWEKTTEVPISYSEVQRSIILKVLTELSKVQGKLVRISIEEVGGGEG